MIFDAIHLAGVRALVSKGWGGLGADDVGLPDGVFMLGNVPHDWLFQHVSCVVHHGGAGTTAAGIKAGKPTFVVPFFGDQPFWGAMIARAKAGPEPIRYKELTVENLAEALKYCGLPETQERAKELGQKIREEQGTDTGGMGFHKHLDVASLRCSVAPSRAAAWRVRRTTFRLSPLAAAVLVEEGLLQYSDMKLYWLTPVYHSLLLLTKSLDIEPSSTIRRTSLLTQSQLAPPRSFGDLTSIGMAVADMPRELFRSSQRSKDGQGGQTPSLESSSKQNLALTQTSSRSVSRVASSTDVSSFISPDTLQAGSSSVQEPSISPYASQQSLPDSLSYVRSGTEIDRCDSREGLNPKPTSSHTKLESSRRDSSPAGLSLNAAVGAGRGVGRAVTTGVKSPMNFCLGLAKGFRNIPRLYNDDTIRPIEKVTDLSSGVKIAGKELGYGFFDGISGLFTQPIRGAEKEGAGGSCQRYR